METMDISQSLPKNRAALSHAGPYQAIYPAACHAALGIRIESDQLVEIMFLPAATPRRVPTDALAIETFKQLDAYFRDPSFRFDLPLAIRGTPFQQSVWQMMCDIQAGATLTYGAVAHKLSSAPRAVGQACGRNPLPVIIPCHRIVGVTGLVGFMRGEAADGLSIKKWLLEHERGRS